MIKYIDIKLISCYALVEVPGYRKPKMQAYVPMTGYGQLVSRYNNFFLITIHVGIQTCCYEMSAGHFYSINSTLWRVASKEQVKPNKVSHLWRTEHLIPPFQKYSCITSFARCRMQNKTSSRKSVICSFVKRYFLCLALSFHSKASPFTLKQIDQGQAFQ